MSAVKRLGTELKSLVKYSEFSCYPKENNLLEWDIIIFGPNDTVFEGGIYQAKMSFPPNYPLKPPEFRFVSKITHPNIYPDGRVCISILHEGVDQFQYEKLSERWNPQHGVASVLLSIISILNQPNFESPANVDASVIWKNNFSQMKKIIYQEVASTQK